MLVGSQQLRMQDPAPIQQCRTEGRTGLQRRKGENGDENRDGNVDEDGVGMGTGTRMETGTKVKGDRARELTK